MSAVKSDNDPDDEGSPNNVIDLDFTTFSKTAAGTDGKTWFRFKLDRTQCVKKVWSFQHNGEYRRYWTCASTGCTACEGDRCNIFALAVYIESAGGEEDFPTLPDCRYGDTVQVERTSDDGNKLTEYELAIIVKGETKTRVDTRDVCL